MAVYPKSAGISFMHGITAIGTKSQKKEDLGPQGQNNITFANGGNDTMSGTLYLISGDDGLRHWPPHDLPRRGPDNYSHKNLSCFISFGWR